MTTDNPLGARVLIGRPTMSDGAGDGSADGGAGGGGGDGGAAGDGGAGGGGAPAWNASLPDDLRNDPGLANYASLEAMARGLVETKALVGRDKVVMPKDDADEAGWNAIYDKLGRPADAKDYDIPLPEGTTPELADAFRPVAHKLGLSAKQAKGVVEFNNAMVAQMQQAGQAEVAALKTAMGADFAPALDKAKAAAKAFGVDDEMADALDAKLGSAKMLQLFMNIGAKMGEHGRIEGDPTKDGGTGDPVAERTALTKDPEFVKKLDAGDAEARRRWDALNNAITQRQLQA